MRYIKSRLIQERASVPFKKISSSDKDVRYSFVVSDLKYYAYLWHDSAKHQYGVYEVEFEYSEQSHAGDRAGKDLRHLNTVINTVCDIVEKEVKERKILFIKIEGAGDEKDTAGFFDPNIRAKIYLRFIKQRYPHDAISTVGRYINIDMGKVYPDLFSEEKDNMQRVLDELLRISDANPDKEGIERGIDGVSAKQFTVNTDFIDNSERGVIYFEIDIWEEANEFSIRWEILDTGEEEEKYFDNSDQLIGYLQGLFK